MAREDGQGIEWDKCVPSVRYFIYTYCLIDDPQSKEGTIIPFDLWPAQQRILQMFRQHRLFIILKARQLGISWLCCAYALWLCVFQSGRRVLLFSQGQNEADELLRRVKVMYERLPEWMLARVGVDKLNTSEIAFSNGSLIESMPATQKSGRSLTASLVIADEFAFMQWASELYTGMKSTIDGGGQLIILSTANGARGLFHQLWKKAIERLNNFVPIFLSWRMRPGRDDGWYARVASEAVSTSLMMQEYPASPEEAFSATDAEKFLADMLWWDNCREEVPPFTRNDPLVLGVDAGINNDSFALVGVTRKPNDSQSIMVRYSREWKPRRDGSVDFAEVDREIRSICSQFNVVEITYDPYQLHDMMQRLRRDGVVLTKDFPQGQQRLEADKQLLDIIMQRRLAHDGNQALRAHIDNADKKVDAETRKIRLIKREDHMKIDLAVALSMASYRCFKLPLG